MDKKKLESFIQVYEEIMNDIPGDVWENYLDDNDRNYILETHDIFQFIADNCCQ